MEGNTEQPRKRYTKRGIFSGEPLVVEFVEMENSREMRRPPEFTVWGPPRSGLRGDEGHRRAPIGVTELTQRADLELLALEDERPRAIYGHDLLLLRPDLHVAWRGNRLPADPARLAALATGR